MSFLGAQGVWSEENEKVREVKFGVLTPWGEPTAISQRNFQAQDPGAAVEILGHFDPLLSFFLSVARYRLRIVEPPKEPVNKTASPDDDGE